MKTTGAGEIFVMEQNKAEIAADPLSTADAESEAETEYGSDATYESSRSFGARVLLASRRRTLASVEVSESETETEYGSEATYESSLSYGVRILPASRRPTLASVDFAGSETENECGSAQNEDEVDPATAIKLLGSGSVGSEKCRFRATRERARGENGRTRNRGNKCPVFRNGAVNGVDPTKQCRSSQRLGGIDTIPTSPSLSQDKIAKEEPESQPKPAEKTPEQKAAERAARAQKEAKFLARSEEQKKGACRSSKSYETLAILHILGQG